MGNTTPEPPPPLPDFNLENELEKFKQTGRTRKIENFCCKHIEKNKNPDACYLYARFKIDLSEYSTESWNMEIAIPHLIIAVERGNKDALMYLALFYYMGGYRAHSHKNSFRTWKIEKDPVSACYDYTYIPLKRNYKKSFEYFTRAAAYLKNQHAYYYVAKHYEKGLGTKKDLSLALTYYKLSYYLGNSDAIKRICETYVKKGLDAMPDADLEIFELGINKIYLGHFYLAKIYHERKDYKSTIFYCDKQLMRNTNFELKDIAMIITLRVLAEKNISSLTPAG
ncbi:MAG: hypothetical protein Harvfovirus30_9 [Harvfovirus sp.]|uniref:Uncharacterized protein n=1 Tax=Harvfovirus sp. TaxID=2487768 RepID=A0A3G5A2C1_9VIRU|nr:MAG: hypothetical protein Harvfovirus30_9 [Harvfovirus sp.]